MNEKIYLKFRRISANVNNEILAGIVSINEPYALEGPYSFKKLPGIGRMKKLMLPTFVLSTEGKLADCICSPYMSRNTIVCSVPMYEKLVTLNLDEHDVYEIILIQNSKSYEYILLHFPFVRNNELIDWNSSTFMIVDGILQKEVNEVEINSKEGFEIAFESISIEGKGRGIKLKKLVFNHSELDLVRLYYPPKGGFFVSEKFKEIVLKHEFTGCKFQAS